MNVLGIETSCDETAGAVVKDGQQILSNAVSTSLHFHKKYGGIIPEIASRKQLELIHFVVDKALKDAKISFKKIDLIAVTSRPGLIGSLLVGTSFARALAFALKKPLIEVDHVKAHLYANFLKQKLHPKPPRLPAIGLVVSGGHSSLYLMKDFQHVKLIGQTRDDAAGETFDKVGRLLKLGFPGGPIIDRLAQRGINTQIRFPCAQLPETFDFSFSGIKTAVLYFVRKQESAGTVAVEKIAYSFQKSVIETLVLKSVLACDKFNIKTLLIGGGVAANSELRKQAGTLKESCGINVYFPELPLCLDNAAMIAGLGYYQYSKKFLS